MLHGPRVERVWPLGVLDLKEPINWGTMVLGDLGRMRRRHGSSRLPLLVVSSSPFLRATRQARSLGLPTRYLAVGRTVGKGTSTAPKTCPRAPLLVSPRLVSYQTPTTTPGKKPGG
jgi:hypothetical protein